MNNSLGKDTQKGRRVDRFSVIKIFLFLSLFLFPAPCLGDDLPADSPGELDIYDDEAFFEDEGAVADPLEPLNRIFFQINDGLYFMVFKPVASIYSAVLFEDIRICIRNAFDNILVPVRVVNNLLQGKVNNSGIELSRFVINSTMGIGGLGDPAASQFGLKAKDEDLGQTLGVYGFGEGMYICWPILGPSNFRDSVGMAGDIFLDPLTYLTADDRAVGAWIYAGKYINKTSLTLGDYELLKETSMDPYVALRDAYQQYRVGKIKE